MKLTNLAKFVRTVVLTEAIKGGEGLAAYVAFQNGGNQRICALYDPKVLLQGRRAERIDKPIDGDKIGIELSAAHFGIGADRLLPAFHHRVPFVATPFGGLTDR